MADVENRGEVEHLVVGEETSPAHNAQDSTGGCRTPLRRTLVVGALLCCAAGATFLFGYDGSIEHKPWSTPSVPGMEQKFKFGGKDGGGRGGFGGPIDADGDGQISGEELSKLSDGLSKVLKVDEEQVQQKLDEGDTNGDGVLDQDEVKAIFQDARKQRTDAMFAKVDQDGSGELEESELEKFAKKVQDKTGMTENEYQAIFQSADSNSDGKLAKDEVPALVKGVFGHMKSKKGEKAKDDE